MRWGLKAGREAGNKLTKSSDKWGNLLINPYKIN